MVEAGDSIREMAERKITAIRDRVYENAPAMVRATESAAGTVLTGTRGGRRYPLPGGGAYTASAPGEAPAYRTGALLASFCGGATVTGERRMMVTLSSSSAAAFYLESGTGRMAARPYKERVTGAARAAVTRVINESMRMG